MRAFFRVFTIVCAFCLAGGAQPARAVLFSASDWTGIPGAVTDIFSSGVTGFSVTTPASGGNPGSALQLSTSLVGSTAVTSRFIAFNGFTYDPGVSGAVDSFDYSVDTLRVAGAHGWGLGFMQDGFVYRLQITAGSSSFQTFSGTGLDASSLIDALNGPAGPGLDFSATGSEIVMGFYFFSGNGGAPSRSDTTLYDNWTITLNQADIPVPAPGLAAIFAIGLVGTIIARNRRA